MFDFCCASFSFFLSSYSALVLVKARIHPHMLLTLSLLFNSFLHLDITSLFAGNDDTFHSGFTYSTDPRSLEGCDYVLVAVKATSTALVRFCALSFRISPSLCISIIFLSYKCTPVIWFSSVVFLCCGKKKYPPPWYLSISANDPLACQRFSRPGLGFEPPNDRQSPKRSGECKIIEKTPPEPSGFGLCSCVSCFFVFLYLVKK